MRHALARRLDSHGIRLKHTGNIMRAEEFLRQENLSVKEITSNNVIMEFCYQEVHTMKGENF